MKSKKEFKSHKDEPFKIETKINWVADDKGKDFFENLLNFERVPESAPNKDMGIWGKLKYYLSEYPGWAWNRNDHDKFVRFMNGDYEREG